VEKGGLTDWFKVARVWGVEGASKLSAILFLSAVIMSFYPFLFVEGYRFDLKYLIPVLITDVKLIDVSVELLRRHGKEDIRRYRKKTLLALTVGLVGFLLGAF